MIFKKWQAKKKTVCTFSRLYIFLKKNFKKDEPTFLNFFYIFLFSIFKI